MKFCDFFAGIGGFRLGLERAGHDCVWSCEWDTFARKVYLKNFGAEPEGKDLNDVKAEDISEAELWCGGFPCQDLSVAGKRGGLQANRSGMWWVWRRLIEQRLPEWLLIENVPGLLSSNGGGDFALFLTSLDEIGYGISWRRLDAQFFGLAQRRKRIFIIGHLGGPCPPEILFEREGCEGNSDQKRTARSRTSPAINRCADTDNKTISGTVSSKWAKGSGGPAGDEAYNLTLAQPYNTAPTIKASGAGTSRTDFAGNEAQFCIISTGHTQANQRPVKRSQISDTLSRAQDFAIAAFIGKNSGKTRGIGYAEEQCPTIDRSAPNVTAPTDTDRMRTTPGVSRRMDTPDSSRYKVLGNAVAVPVVEWIGRRLARYEAKHTKESNE